MTQACHPSVPQMLTFAFQHDLHISKHQGHFNEAVMHEPLLLNVMHGNVFLTQQCMQFHRMSIDCIMYISCRCC